VRVAAPDAELGQPLREHAYAILRDAHRSPGAPAPLDEVFLPTMRFLCRTPGQTSTARPLPLPSLWDRAGSSPWLDHAARCLRELDGAGDQLPAAAVAPARVRIPWRALLGVLTLDLAVAAALLAWFGDDLIRFLIGGVHGVAKVVVGLGSLDLITMRGWLLAGLFDLSAGLPPFATVSTVLLLGATGALLAAGGSGIATLGLPGTAGVPDEAVANTWVLPYNEVPVLDGDVAAVIVEPVAANMGVVAPIDGYHEAVRELTRRHGAMLIYDEVKTGATIAYGGAIERFGIMPDLICLAKAIGGGLPIGHPSQAQVNRTFQTGLPLSGVEPSSKPTNDASVSVGQLARHPAHSARTRGLSRRAIRRAANT
jgi:hypothetical protein